MNHHRGTRYWHPLRGPALLASFAGLGIATTVAWPVASSAALPANQTSPRLAVRGSASLVPPVTERLLELLYRNRFDEAARLFAWPYPAGSAADRRAHKLTVDSLLLMHKTFGDIHRPTSREVPDELMLGGVETMDDSFWKRHGSESTKEVAFKVQFAKTGSGLVHVLPSNASSTAKVRRLLYGCTKASMLDQLMETNTKMNHLFDEAARSGALPGLKPQS